MTGAGLRRLRRQHGLTQQALAVRLGVTANSVARWERGERTITPPIARLIHLTLFPATPVAAVWRGVNARLQQMGERTTR
jgi:transcriptional regulator with XRE-family HTH domain